MNRFSNIPRRALALVTAAFLLRALVPAGYMVAAPGQGLLFELCHEGMPPEIMAAIAGHEHGHAHHGHHGGDEAANGDCSVGHLLNMAMIDAADRIEIVVVPAVWPADSAAADSISLLRRYSSPPRGPPFSQIPSSSA